MLEGVLSDVLSRVLGKYVRDLNSESLRVAVWGGDVELKNLQLKPEALDDLAVPLSMRGGVIGSLSMTVPWHNFISAPLQLRLSDVSIIVQSRTEQEWDGEAEESKKARNKKKKLAKLERQKANKRQQAVATKDAAPQGDTLTSRLTARAIQSIQVYIDNIHIRYEDSRYPGMPFSAGITLESATLTSTDETFTNFHFEDEKNLIHKLVALQNMAVYWNPMDKPLAFKDDEDLAKKMSSLIYRKDLPPAAGMNFLAGPVCGSTKLRMHKSRVPDMDIPKLTLDVLFELIQVELSELQLLEMVKLAEWMMKFSARDALRRYRPFLANVKQKPKAWWRFAYKSLAAATAEKRERWSKKALAKRRRNRLAYIQQWQAYVRTKVRTPMLDALEEELTFETVAYFRSLAEAQMKPSELVAKKTGGWLNLSSWLGGSGAAEQTEADEDLDADSEFYLTPAQRKLFYQSIGYDGKEDTEPLNFAVDPEYVKFEVNVLVEQARLMLRGMEGSELKPILEATAGGFAVNMKVRPTSQSVQATLDDLRVYDRFTKKSIMPEIFRPLVLPEDRDDVFFRVAFEKNPLDSDDDMQVNLRLEGTDIVIYKPWIMRLVQMFKHPFANPGGSVQKAAKRSIETVRNLTMEQVTEIVEDHKKLGCNISARAPRLIIPEDLDQGETTFLIVDLGDLSVVAQPRTDASDIKEGDRWQDHLYDQFRIDATNLQLLLMSSAEWPANTSVDQPKHRMLLRKFDISVSLAFLMTSANSTLAKIRFSGFIPSVDFFFTGVKIRNLLRVLLAIAEDPGPPKPLPKFVKLVAQDVQAEMDEGVELLLIDDFTGTHPNKVDELLVDQKVVECHFSIAGGTIELSRDLPRPSNAPLELGEGPTAPLALVAVEGLVVQYVLRKADMVAYVGVHGITIEDLMQCDGEEFRYIGTSKLMPDQKRHPKHLKDDDEDLIKIAYEMVKTKSPHYAGLDNQVDLAFNTLYFNFNRMTVLAIWDVLQVAFMSEGKRKLARKVRRFQEHGVEVHEAYRRAVGVEELPDTVDMERLEAKGSEDVDDEDTRKQKAAEVEELVKKEPPSAILVKVTVTIKCVSLVLNRLGTASALAVLQNSAVLYQYHESIMDVKLMLGSMVLEDLSALAHYYPRIMSIHGEEMVHMTYRQYTPEFADYPGYRHKLRLRVQSIHFVVLQRFLFEMSDYMSEMTEMNRTLRTSIACDEDTDSYEQTRAAEAAALAAKKREAEAKEQRTSRERAQEVFLYEVMLMDFGVLWPKNSRSEEFIQVDMGKIAIANSYFDYEAVESDLVGQRMSFSMTAANAQSGSAVEPGKLFQIIDDVDFLVEFEMPLGDKEHLVPGFKLSADISPIHSRCTERQYALFRNVISQNLTERSLRSNEGAQGPPLPKTQEVDETLAQSMEDEQKEKLEADFDGAMIGVTAADAVIDVAAAIALENASPAEDDVLARVHHALYEQVWVSVALSFNFQKITMEIMDYDDSGDGLVPIAQGCMNDFGFAIINTSDGGNKMDYAFESLTIRDSRAPEKDEKGELQQNQFAVLFSHEEQETPEEESEVLGGMKDAKGKMGAEFEPQFRFYYINDPNGKKRMSITLRNPRLVMVPVVYTIVNFFLSPLIDGELPDAIRESIEDDRKAKATRGHIKAQQAQEDANRRADIPSLAPENVVDTAGADYEYFDEINEDEQADLVLDVHLVGMVIKLPEAWSKRDSKGIIARGGFLMKLTTVGKCSSIRAFAERVHMYSAVLREEYTTSIPIIKPIDLSLAYKSCATECDVEIDIEPLVVTFSYRDFKCIMALVACLTPPAQDKDELTVKAADQAEKVSVEKEQRVKQDQSLVVNTGGVQITLLDDLAGHNVPLINFRMVNLFARMDSWSSALSALMGFTVQVDYHNRRLALWEPMVELWPCTVKYFKTPVPESNPVEYNSKASIHSERFLNANLSKVFFDTMKQVLKSWSLDYLQSPGSAPVPREKSIVDDYSIFLRNDTGRGITYWDDDDETHRVEDGVQAPLFINVSRRGHLANRDVSLDQHITTIAMRVDGGWDRLEHLPVSRVGSWIIALKPKADNTSVRIVYTIEHRDGIKIITVRSNVTVKNASSVPILLRAEVPQKGRVDLAEAIAPGERRSIPLQFCNSACCRFRPAHSEFFGYSSNFINCRQLTEETLTLECRAMEEDDDVNTGEAWYFNVSVDLTGEGKLAGRHCIIISPPFQLENLLVEPLRYSLWCGAMQLADNQVLQRAERVNLYTVPSREKMDVSISLQGFNTTKRETLRSMDIKLVDSKKRELIVIAEVAGSDSGTSVVSFYCKYWMVNRTGLRLLYQKKAGMVSTGDVAAGQVEAEKQVVELGEDQSTWYDAERTEELSRPFMYSYSTNDIFGNKTCVKIANSKWSKPISIESVGTDGTLSIEGGGKHERSLFEMGVNIELMQGRFHRTKRITFSPRYVLVNRINRNLYFRQDSQNAGFLLPAGKSVPYHWPFANKPQELCITFSPKHTWSASFSIGEIADFAVKISRTSNANRSTVQLIEESYLARVEIQLVDATFYVLFKPEAVDVPPYRIENMTKWNMFIHQKCKRDQPQTVPAHGKASFTWDIPNAPHKLSVEVPALSFQSHYNLDKIKVHPVETVEGESGPECLRARIFADGPTRVFRLTNAATVTEEDEDESLALQMNDATTVVSQYVLELEGLGLSIIDNAPQELVYISLRKVCMDVSNSVHEMRLELRVFDFQVDNQLLTASFPVLLSRNPAAPADQDFFHFSMVKSNHYQSIDFFHYFACRFQEMDAKVDDDIINRLLAFFNVAFDTDAEIAVGGIGEGERVRGKAKTSEVASDIGQPGESAKKLYFVMFHLNPIKCNLTFTYSNRQSDAVAMTGAGTLVVETSEEETGSNPVASVLSAIGVTVASIEDAPISLNTLFLQHAFHTRAEFMSRITKHFYMQLLTEVYKVVLSFDIIGNPVSMVQNLGTGVHDFFYEPAQGLVQSPKDFVVGLGKGSTSLAKNSVVGIFNTASKITGTLGKGVAHLAFDRQYVRQREISGREKPRHIGEGLILGVEELSSGLYQGLTGVVTAPISGARKEGVGGLLKGVTRGMIGAAVKPGVGLFDLATRTTQGIRNTATYFDKSIHRVRAPRGFGPGRVLTPYNVEKAVGQSLLRTIDEGSYAFQWHLFHCVSQAENLLMVSNKQLIYINVSQPQTIWRCTLASVTSVETNGKSLVVSFLRNQNAWAWLYSAQKDQQTEKTVKLPSEDDVQWFSAKLKKTIAIVSRFDEDEDDLALSESVDTL